MNYDEALNWIYNIRRFGPNRTLEPTRHILKLLGDPQNKFMSIHIGGTNGKGSTTAMIASILRAQGYNVGLYISPHLENFNERISVNTEYIADSDIAILLSQIKPLFEKMLKYHKIMPLRFFDVVTAMAFVYFAKKCVDFAVLEVGLGGRLDATNIVQPLVSVITNIGFEHTNILGETLTEIAHEKAGIIKPKSVLVTAAQNPEVLDVFRVKAENLGVPIFRVGEDVSFYKISSSIYDQHFKITAQETYDNVSISLLGDHQLINAVTAVKTAEVLRNYDITISKSSIVKGLRDVIWPARLEVITQNPLIVLDCAKDAEATEAVVHTIEDVFEYDRLISVVAISSDKNHEGMIYNIAKITSHFILTTHGVKRRSTDPHILAEIVKRHEKSFEIVYPAEKALKRAQKLARKNDMILIIGSVFLAGKLRKLLVK